MVDIISGEIKLEFTIEVYTVPGKMKGQKIRLIDDRIEVKFGNVLAVVNKTNQGSVQIGVVGNDFTIESFFPDLSVYEDIFIGISLIAEFPHISIQAGIDCV